MPKEVRLTVEVYKKNPKANEDLTKEEQFTFPNDDAIHKKIFDKMQEYKDNKTYIAGYKAELF